MTQEKTTKLETTNIPPLESPRLLDLSSQVPGKYKDCNIVATGGMKRVTKVRDIDTDRYIAMATLLENKPTKESVQQFLREARIHARLEHPNIVPVYEIGQDLEHHPYFTMKMINGKTLQEVIIQLRDCSPRFKQKYNLDYLLNVIIKVCDAVAYAHSMGVIHLDLKPDNILLGRHAEVLVMDWGLARYTRRGDHSTSIQETADNKDSSLFQCMHVCTKTKNGITKGTPRYMSPEQAAARNDDRNEKSDIYCLGAILYAILTLKAPIEGKSVTTVLKNTIEGVIVPPHIRTPGRNVPRALEEIAMKALSLDPVNRYDTVKQFRKDISFFRRKRATSIEYSSIVKRLTLLPRRNVPATIFASLFLATLILLIISLFV